MPAACDPFHYFASSFNQGAFLGRELIHRNRCDDISRGVFSFVAPLSPPVSYMGPAVGVWMILGLIYLIYLYNRDPRRVTEVGLVHLDAEIEPAAGAPSRS